MIVSEGHQGHLQTRYGREGGRDISTITAAGVRAPYCLNVDPCRFVVGYKVGSPYTHLPKCFLPRSMTVSRSPSASQPR
jgi:hypothetical protein